MNDDTTGIETPSDGPETPPPPREWTPASGRRPRSDRRARIAIGACGWESTGGDRSDPGDALAAYAVDFDIVEIESTFDGIPSPTTVATWRQRTLAPFRFAAKAPRAITHVARLVDAEDDLDAFCEAMRPLGTRLAAVLLQLPPSMTYKAAADLDRFLDDLPTDIRFALEARHRSWIRQETFDLLRGHRVAWTIADFKDWPIVPAVTADFAYVRLLGTRDDVPPPEIARTDRRADLAAWRDRIRDLATFAPTIYGFVSPHYGGDADGDAIYLREILGLPVGDRAQWQQASLLDEV